MRYFKYVELEQDGLVTVSEEEIKQTYYPWWKERMIKKFGEEEFNRTYTFEHCLEDWMTIHWASEVSQ
jgi:hypothetical protein